MSRSPASSGSRDLRQRGPRWLPQWLGRLLYLRLVIPIRRDRNGLQNIARGAMVGAFIGMTPTVGVQIPIVLVIWWGLRWLGWHFSLILAIAWTWLSNPATLLPLYYLFYQTGGLVLRLFAHTAGNDAAVSLPALLKAAGTAKMPESALLFLNILEVAGLQMMIGCLPYALSLGLFAYWLVRWLGLGYGKLQALRRGGGEG